MKIINLCLMMMALVSSTTSFAQQDTVTRDVSNGDWVYTLQNPDDHNKQFTWRYTPRNQIAPSVKSSMHWNGKNFVYRYKVSNGNKAKHALAYIWLRAPIVVQSTLGAPADPTLTGAFSKSDYGTVEFGKLYAQYLEGVAAQEKATLTAPPKWYTRWNIKHEGHIEFGWFPTVKDDNYDGVEIGKTVNGFSITRPELPGVMFAETQGATDSRMILGGLPETGPIADAVKTMVEEDTVWTPVMVPAIVIPQPYNGAELARRIKAHANYWLKLGLITQDTLDRLNRGFDSLIAAQTYNNITGTHAAVKEILQEAYSHHRGLNHTKNEEDDDEHDAEPVKRKAPATEPINRVAARALSFDLTYLLTRAYVGK